MRPKKSTTNSSSVDITGTCYVLKENFDFGDILLFFPFTQIQNNSWMPFSYLWIQSEYQFNRKISLV